ncbi:MAG: hypothetical protein MUE50_05545 [Pirellulaceae bacterium]|nr:hypothetical protein [Pirellulaceae bacterium]
MLVSQSGPVQFSTAARLPPLPIPFQFPDGRRLTLASYCAVRPPQAYVEPVETGMTLPGIALFLDPQWYVTVPLEGTYCAAWEAIPARWRRLLSE